MTNYSLCAIRYLLIISLLVFSVGCEAFVRKFTRKQKKDNLPREEMVLEPQVYTVAKMSAQEQYRQYFLYWKSWMDELIESLSAQGSHKKQLSCLKEAIKNFDNLNGLVDEELKKIMFIYSADLKALEYAIEKDPYGNNYAMNRRLAERIKRNVLRDLSYGRAKDYLKGEEK